jgi:hypothetical protein
MAQMPLLGLRLVGTELRQLVSPKRTPLSACADSGHPTPFESRFGHWRQGPREPRTGADIHIFASRSCGVYTCRDSDRNAELLEVSEEGLRLEDLVRHVHARRDATIGQGAASKNRRGRRPEANG